MFNPYQRISVGPLPSFFCAAVQHFARGGKQSRKRGKPQGYPLGIQPKYENKLDTISHQKSFQANYRKGLLILSLRRGIFVSDPLNGRNEQADPERYQLIDN